MKTYTFHIDENNIFLIQKIMYFFDVNDLVKDSIDFQFNGIIDVRGTKIIFAIPKNKFTFTFDNEEITYKYKKYQKSKVDRGSIIRMDKIILSSTSKIAIKSFLHTIEKMEFQLVENKLIKYSWKDTYWKYCGSFKKRNINTLYLPETIKNCILKEIDSFLNKDNEFYHKLCLPRRKIFLFWGLPGTGKTTFIRSIASMFNKNIAIIKNTFDIDDGSLEVMIEELPKDSIVLFEDIDVLFNGRTNVANTNITFNGLLNFLDGIVDYDKLLIFITTNHFNEIDAALRRRIDVFMEFTYIKKPEIRTMFNNFFSDSYDFNKFIDVLNVQVTPNVLEKYFIKCILTNVSPIENIEYLYTYIKYTNHSKNTLYS